MKALMLIHGLGVGGSESMVARLAAHLRAAGSTVEIDCLDELGLLGEELRAQGFVVILHARRPGIDTTLPGRLARRIRRSRFDVVHVHQRPALFYGLLAGLLHSAPLVYTEHGPAYGATRRRQALFNRLLRWRLSQITAVSEHLKHSLSAVEGFAAESIEVVANAVDAARFAGCSPGEREAARTAIGLPATVPVLGTVGRLEEVKNHALLLYVLARLTNVLPNLLLVLVGDGPARDGLSALARDLGVHERVRFLGVRRDVERLLPAFDVFAMSSIAEGIPLSLLEAMAARVPIVATTVGGIPEAVRHDREAVLVDGEPPVCHPGHGPTPLLPSPALAYLDRFADAIASLLGDPERARRLTDAAFRRVTGEFSAAAMCSRYEEILLRAARGE